MLADDVRFTAGRLYVQYSLGNERPDFEDMTTADWLLNRAAALAALKY